MRLLACAVCCSYALVAAQPGVWWPGARPAGTSDRSRDTSQGSWQAVRRPELPPVVFFMGLMGAKLYASLDKPGVIGCGPSVRCACHGGPFEIYPSVEALVLFASCTLNNLQLEWDNGRLSPVAGVNISVDNHHNDPAMPGFKGNLPYPAMQRALIQQFGYSMRQFRSVAWDWRLGPAQWAQQSSNYTPASGSYSVGQFARLKSLFEQLELEFGQPALAVTISEGSTFLRLFLDTVDAGWKQSHVGGWVSYSGVWAGASEMAYNQLSGDDFYPEQMRREVGFSTFTAEQMRAASQAWPGLALVSPWPTGRAETDNATLFVTPSRNFSYAEYSSALRAAGLDVTAEVMESVRPVLPQLTSSPGVRLWCLYGYGVPTRNTMVYDRDFNGVHRPAQPVGYLRSSGDGTVHQGSLAVCDNWVGGAKLVSVHRYFNQSHVGLMSSNLTYPVLYGAINEILSHSKGND